MAQNKAMADQIMTVSKERLTERLELPSPNEMHGVDNGHALSTRARGLMLRAAKRPGARALLSEVPGTPYGSFTLLPGSGTLRLAWAL